MAKHRADNGHEKIQPRTTVQGKETRRPMLIENPYGKEHQHDANGNGIDDHRLGIELQMLLVSCTNAGNADYQQCHHLAMQQMSVLINVHQLDAVMDVHENAAPMIQGIGVNGILEELNDKGNVDECPKHLVECLEVFAFFHSRLLFLVQPNADDRSCGILTVLVCHFEASR